jgi:trk system potassium uptake protein TrkH
MNGSIIRYIIGTILKTEAALLLLPCIIALIYGEKEGFAYLLVAALSALTGFLLTLKKASNHVFYLKEGCVSTALSWIFLSLFGCFPFLITGEISSFTDALFETVSGFTTTGASILSDVESLSYTSLFWRSFTHWVGGMGVLVFILAIMPMSGGSNINLMRAESPGPSVGKLVPKLKTTARILYLIYFGMTMLEVLLLLAGNMPVFDSFVTSFGTAGTGGFGIKNDSIGSYSSYIQWIVTIFMILFGVNFNAFYLIVFGKIKKALRMEEVRYYFLIILAAVGIIFFNIWNTSMGAADALRHASFQVASIITTTGYSTLDFDTWSQTCKTVLVFLMFIGACAGSTGGGIKVSRIVIMIKTVIKELNSYIHPKSIKKIKFEGKPVEHEVVRSINVYLITFVTLFSLSVFLVSFEGRDLVTTFTAVAATINNIGPGLNEVGPSCNFGILSIFSKWVLIFDMLAGRLELFPLLILFHPHIWRDFIGQKIKLRKKKLALRSH